LIDISTLSGEFCGDLNGVFFEGLDMNSPQTNNSSTVEDELLKIEQNIPIHKNKTIHIPTDNIQCETSPGINIPLTEIELIRRQQFNIRSKKFIDLNTGEEVSIKDKTEMYNGTILYIVEYTNNKTITYPRGMFIGENKQFLLKELYIKQAEHIIINIILDYKEMIYNYIKDDKLIETEDKKFLELILPEGIDLQNDIYIPDHTQIPIGIDFDIDYKYLNLDFIICVNNKIAGLLFSELWF